jgi:hypothetical protein
MLSRKIDWARVAIWLSVAAFGLFLYWGKMPSGALDKSAAETFQDVAKQLGTPDDNGQ